MDTGREEESTVPHGQDIAVVLMEAQSSHGAISPRLLGRRRRTRSSTGGKATSSSPTDGPYTTSFDTATPRGATRACVVELAAAAAAATSRRRTTCCVATTPAATAAVNNSAKISRRTSSSSHKGVSVRPQKFEAGGL